MPSPTATDLRALAAALPPSERLAASEVADVLSSVVAVITHGPAILEAAKEGGDKVYEFFHNAIAKQAEADGVAAPIRGQVSQEAPPATPVAPSQAVDYDKLAAAIVKAQQAQNAPVQDAPRATDTPPATPVQHDVPTSSTDTPATHDPASFWGGV